MGEWEGLEGMVLAAGHGRRMFPLTALRAKPAVPFLGRPLIRYSLDLMEKAGIKNVTVNLHHLPETVRKAARGSAARIRYSYEEELLGTAGGIAKAFAERDVETLVAVNGKIYFEQDLAPLIADHRKSGAWATLAVVPFRPEGGYNPVYLDRNGSLTAFGQADPERGEQRPFVFTGVQALDRRVVARLPEAFCDTVKDVFPKLIAEGRPVRGFVSRAYWCENSLPGRYLRRSLDVLRRRGQSTMGVGDSARLAGVIASPGARIAGGAQLEDCILWEDADVGAAARLRRVIVAGQARLPKATELEDAIVTPILNTKGRKVGPGAIRGECMIWPLEKPS